MAPSDTLFHPSWLAPLLCYMLASVGMTLTNKLVLSAFRPLSAAVFLVLATQALVSVVVLSLTSAGFKRPTLAQTRAWAPVALLQGAMLYTGGRAIAALPVGAFTVTKNLAIVCVAYAERFTVGTQVTGGMLAAFALMLASSGVAAWADLSAHGATGEAANWAGYAWVALNCVTSAAFVLRMRATIRRLKLQDAQTAYLNNLLTAPIFLVLSYLVDPRWDSFAPEAAEMLPRFIIAALGSGLGGVAIAFASAWCVRVVNATTYSMAGALNKLPVGIAGMAFLGEPVTTGSVSSIFLGFAAGMMYSHAKRKADQAARDGPKSGARARSPLGAPRNAALHRVPILPVSATDGLSSAASSGSPKPQRRID